MKATEAMNAMTLAKWSQLSLLSILFLIGNISQLCAAEQPMSEALPVEADVQHESSPQSDPPLSTGSGFSSGWRQSHLFATRYNPLGLQSESFLGYRWALRDLYGASEESRLFGKSYLWTGAISRFSPQFAQIGAFVKTLPIAVLELQGSFTRNFVFSDAERVRESGIFTEGTKDALDIGQVGSADAIITAGWQASLQARFQIKVGAIAARNTNLFRRFELDAEGETGRFYDQSLDVVTPFKSWVYQNDSDLLYAAEGSPWILGLRYTITTPLSDEMQDIQRVGPLFVWKFLSPDPEELSQAIVVLSQWHLEHRSRAGQVMDQMIPYFAILYSRSSSL